MIVVGVDGSQASLQAVAWAMREAAIRGVTASDAEQREAAERLARRTFSDLVALRCTALPQLIAQRLAHRAGGMSDADQAIATAMTAKVAPWPDAIEIDTSVSPEQALERVLAAIHARWTTVPWRFRRPELEPG